MPPASSHLGRRTAQAHRAASRDPGGPRSRHCNRQRRPATALDPPYVVPLRDVWNRAAASGDGGTATTRLYLQRTARGVSATRFPVEAACLTTTHRSTR